jgi:hypothetical protein
MIDGEAAAGRDEKRAVYFGCMVRGPPYKAGVIRSILEEEREYEPSLLFITSR